MKKINKSEMPINYHKILKGIISKNKKIYFKLYKNYAYKCKKHLKLKCKQVLVKCA